MTDIPREMIDRACDAFIKELQPQSFAQRDRETVESAVRHALWPLSMDTAPRNGSSVALYYHGDGEMACAMPCYWCDGAEGWIAPADIYYFDDDDEDLIGWFPIIGGTGHD